MTGRKAVVHKNVSLGSGCTIEDFSIIGAPVGGESVQPETVIGDGAIIRSHTVIYAGNVIGKNLRTGNKANIREHNVIGDDVSIGTLSVVEHHVRIGKGARLHSCVFVPEYSVLEDGCWLGPHVVLTNAKYPNTPITKKELKGPVIGAGARIGANSTILPGVNIGRFALIGAGSVVTKDVRPHSIVIGNPAYHIGWACECGISLAPSGEHWECPVCGSRFRMEGEARKVS